VEARMQIGSTTPMAAAGGAQKPAGGFFASAAPEETGARKEFSDYMKKSPAEQMRDQILKAMGLTEDQLKAMPPEKRAAIEEKIKEMIKTKVEEAQEKKTGVLVDIKA
jgi:TPP-dependent pyruvate/acetoin dehydrogenase alpha subunit